MMRPYDITGLRRWNLLWLTLLLLTWMGLGLNWYLQSFAYRALSPRVILRPNGDITVAASQDGPFVITHLMTYGASETDKRVAALDPPVAYFDSRGITISAARIKQLVWLDTWGKRKAAPKAGAALRILYLRPEQNTIRE